MAGAGAPGPDTMAIPPKIWDGGGANNNLNTANNWGFNETPKEHDALLFAGGTRLTPNNDFTANTQFASLMFSNNAGAFVLGGNALNLGGFITDDSASVETLNLSLDFSYGLNHVGTNRTFTVSAPGGSLVINGNLAGNTNAYFNSYSVTKAGSGTLTLNGTNTFIATLFRTGAMRSQSGNLRKRAPASC